MENPQEYLALTVLDSARKQNMCTVRKKLRGVIL